MNVETKVGIFVIIGFFMVAVTAAVFGNLELNSKEGKTVYFRLNDATGIRNGTPIMYKGLKVGEVKDVMMKDNQIITRVNVYHEFDIPDNVRFNVKQSGFVGQKFVEFEIDPAVKSQATLKDNYEYKTQILIDKDNNWYIKLSGDPVFTTDDLIRTVKDQVGDVVVIPSIMLRPYSEDFLDGKNLDFVKQETKKDFFVVQNIYSMKEFVDYLYEI